MGSQEVSRRDRFVGATSQRTRQSSCPLRSSGLRFTSSTRTGKTSRAEPDIEILGNDEGTGNGD